MARELPVLGRFFRNESVEDQRRELVIFVTPTVFDGPGNRDKLMNLLRGFFSGLKGWHVQYNVVDRETLLAARKDPASHRDLVVRVAGYSAFFTNLSPEMQDNIIERTEQRI